MLTNYKKQCSILSSEAEIHEFMSKCIGICSGLSKLILAEMFLTEDETRAVKKYLWTSRFLSTKQWDTFIMKKAESLHCSINNTA